MLLYKYLKEECTSHSMCMWRFFSLQEGHRTCKQGSACSGSAQIACMIEWYKSIASLVSLLSPSSYRRIFGVWSLGTRTAKASNKRPAFKRDRWQSSILILNCDLANRKNITYSLIPRQLDIHVIALSKYLYYCIHVYM